MRGWKGQHWLLLCKITLDLNQGGFCSASMKVKHVMALFFPWITHQLNDWQFCCLPGLTSWWQRGILPFWIKSLSECPYTTCTQFWKEWAASTTRECFLWSWNLHWHWELWSPLVGLQETRVWPSTTSCSVLPTLSQQHQENTATPHLEGFLPGSYHLAPRGHLASCSWLVCLYVPTFVAHPEWSSLTGLTHILSLSLSCNFSKPCARYWWLLESASSHSYLPTVSGPCYVQGMVKPHSPTHPLRSSTAKQPATTSLWRVLNYFWSKSGLFAILAP